MKLTQSYHKAVTKLSQSCHKGTTILYKNWALVIFSVVTCGADRSIKVWNYLSLELELSKEFEESIESVALHPTGSWARFSKLLATNLALT
jgi:hypothetical protein